MLIKHGYPKGCTLISVFMFNSKTTYSIKNLSDRNLVIAGRN